MENDLIADNFRCFPENHPRHLKISKTFRICQKAEKHPKDFVYIEIPKLR